MSFHQVLFFPAGLNPRRSSKAEDFCRSRARGRSRVFRGSRMAIWRIGVANRRSHELDQAPSPARSPSSLAVCSGRAQSAPGTIVRWRIQADEHILGVALISPKRRMFWNLRASPRTRDLVLLLPLEDLPSSRHRSWSLVHPRPLREACVVFLRPFGRSDPGLSSFDIEAQRRPRASRPRTFTVGSFTSTSCRRPQPRSHGRVLLLWATSRSNVAPRLVRCDRRPVPAVMLSCRRSCASLRWAGARCTRGGGGAARLAFR